MKNMRVVLLTLAIGLLLPTVSRSQMTHVVVLDSSEMAALRKAMSDNERVRELYDSVASLASKQVTDTPRPLKKLYYEGLLPTNPNRIDTQRSLEDIDKVIHFIYASYGSDDPVFAQKTKQFVLAWAVRTSRTATQSTRTSLWRCSGVITCFSSTSQTANEREWSVG